MKPGGTAKTVWLFGFAYGLICAAIAFAVVDMVPADSRPAWHKLVHALMFLGGAVGLVVAVVRRRRESRAEP